MSLYQHITLQTEVLLCSNFQAQEDEHLDRPHHHHLLLLLAAVQHSQDPPRFRAW